MADKIRREKTILKKSVDRYVKAVVKDYSKYFEGSPTYITYYQLDDMASLQDVGLEAVNSLVGSSSPNKYKKIDDVVVYNVDALDLSTQIGERGLSTEINGEFVLLPDSIKPKVNDFFVFDYDGLQDHLFRINDVQFDRAAPNRFYRVSYNLYPNNADEILSNIDDEYELVYNNIGGEETTIIKKADARLIEGAKKLIDGIIERYVKMFYDEDIDAFMYNDGTFRYWSTYLQHFMHKHGIIKKYKSDILTEIYIQDVDEFTNPDIFKEKAYLNSIFRKIELQDKVLTYNNSFMDVLGYNLKSTKNLPFFNSRYDYKLIAPLESIGSVTLYDTAKSILFPDADFSNIDCFHKVSKMDSAHLSVIADKLSLGDIVVEYGNGNELEITRVGMVLERIGNCNHIEKYITDISIDSMMDSDDVIPNQELFGIVKKYLQGILFLDEDLLKTLNNYYYENSMRSYIFMPIIIYILRDIIKEH